ncbi:MAG: PKD domain-containing protein, partial [Candidatus Bathyarchaeota archaeon]|nr:PKD domain-containing protein [Candidatus Bathyarchaeum sp.]
MKKTVFFLIVALLSTLVFPAVFTQAGSGVEVAGILDSSTTWIQENSPYEITETIQIPEDVVLTIEPGVTVTFSGEGNMFLVGGAVQAEGTIDEKIVFQGTGADNFFEVVDHEGSLTLDYCVFDGAQHLWDIGDGVDQVILRHSEIMNVAEHSGLVHWRKPCYIEYNLFINSGGFGMYNWFGTDSSAKMYIRCNVVKANSDVFVSCSSSVYGLGFVIQYNSFVDVEGTLLSVFTGLGTWDITATENYWGTTDTEIIDSLINDKSDDISLPVEIEYSPFLTGPHADGAILPITVGFEYSPDELYVDVEFEVDASASFAEYSAIANYTWDFGDGTIETLDESDTTYSFDAAGDYGIVLTVTDEYGFQNSTST